MDPRIRSRMLAGLLVLPLLAAAAPCFAQTDADSVDAVEIIEGVASTQGDSTAAVKLLGRKLFDLPSVSVIGAEKRAQIMSETILHVAKNVRMSPADLRALKDERIQASLLLCGNYFIGAVWDHEATALGKTTDELANERIEIIRQAVIDYRHDFRPRSLIRGAVVATVTIVALVILLTVVLRLRRRLEGGISERFSGKTLFKVITGEALVSIVSTVIRLVHFIFAAWVLLATVNFILTLFPWTYGFAATVFDLALGPLKSFSIAFVKQIPALFFLAFVVVATVFTLRGIRFFFDEIEANRIRIRGFYADWAKPTYNIVRIVVIAFGFVFAFPYIPGSNSSAFKGVSIFAGLLVSIGSGSSVANIISGIILTYMRPFALGDRVQIGDTVGDVVDRNLLVTRIRTTKNERVTIPNTSILSGHIVNFTSKRRTTQLILHTTVTIGYDAPWRTVHQLLIDAATETEHILADPPPFVLQLGLHDFYIEYELNASTDEPRNIPATYSALHEKIQDKFNNAGVAILSPHYRTHRRDSDASGDRPDDANPQL